MVTTINNTTKLQVARDAAFEEVIFDEEYTNAASHQFADGDLPYATNLYARVQQSSDLGTTNWSRTTRFKLKVPAKVIGVCLDLKSTKKGRFWWIDAEGRKLDEFDYTRHPLFQNISLVTEDSDRLPVAMTRIPTVYIKTATMGPVGTFSNGKKCWWISDKPLYGFRPHPAFKRTTTRDDADTYAISPYVTIGTYMACSETVGGKACLGSAEGRTPLAAQGFDVYETLCNNRNNDTIGQLGWRLYDIYDEALLRLLTLIMHGDGDTSKLSSVGSMTTTGASSNRLVFSGTQQNPIIWIDDMWRFYYTVLYGITMTETFDVELKSPMDPKADLEITDFHKLAVNSGWVRDFLHAPVRIGDDIHNLQELFLPSIAATTEDQSPIGDTYQTGRNRYMVAHGSYNRGTSETGMFHTVMVPENGNAGYATPRTTSCRICKN